MFSPLKLKGNQPIFGAPFFSSALASLPTQMKSYEEETDIQSQ